MSNRWHHFSISRFSPYIKFLVIFKMTFLTCNYKKKNVLNFNFRYVDSAQSLARETNIDLSKYEVCDNIDLETILMEYESYYYVKFSKYPKITKKLGPQSGKSWWLHQINQISQVQAFFSFLYRSLKKLQNCCSLEERAIVPPIWKTIILFCLL